MGLREIDDDGWIVSEPEVTDIYHANKRLSAEAITVRE